MCIVLLTNAATAYLFIINIVPQTKPPIFYPRCTLPLADGFIPEGRVGGGTPIFSNIRRLGSFFGFKILNFIIFGGFQKN